MVEEFGTMLGLNNIRISLETEAKENWKIDTEEPEKNNLLTVTREFTAQLTRMSTMGPESR